MAIDMLRGHDVMSLHEPMLHRYIGTSTHGLFSLPARDLQGLYCGVQCVSRLWWQVVLVLTNW